LWGREEGEKKQGPLAGDPEDCFPICGTLVARDEGVILGFAGNWFSVNGDRGGGGRTEKSCANFPNPKSFASADCTPVGPQCQRVASNWRTEEWCGKKGGRRLEEKGARWGPKIKTVMGELRHDVTFSKRRFFLFGER